MRGLTPDSGMGGGMMKFCSWIVLGRFVGKGCMVINFSPSTSSSKSVRSSSSGAAADVTTVLGH
uniref:Uncharacterized protein n=1 Tax=Romanomermis culicivorax TaxID=13658 RepID=A0A915I1L1_ROMCU